MKIIFTNDLLMYLQVKYFPSISYIICESASAWSFTHIIFLRVTLC